MGRARNFTRELGFGRVGSRTPSAKSIKPNGTEAVKKPRDFLDFKGLGD